MGSPGAGPNNRKDAPANASTLWDFHAFCLNAPFVKDFAAAWTKVMNLDRYDLV
jgi:hypothetical protein